MIAQQWSKWQEGDHVFLSCLPSIINNRTELSESTKMNQEEGTMERATLNTSVFVLLQSC